MRVSALSPGLSLDVYIGRLFLDALFWMSDLDVLKPEHLSTRDPDAFDFDYFSYFNHNYLCKYIFKKFRTVYLKLVRVLVSP